MSIDLYIGPVIERDGRFAYDTFSDQDGLRSSFRYPRVEQAYYDRRSMIVEWRRAAQVRVHVCETLAEFERACAGNGDPDDVSIVLESPDC
jgi:hypothetical protein